MPDHRIQTTSSVQKMLNIWTSTKESAGLPPPTVSRSLTRVCNPMEIKAKTKNQSRYDLVDARTPLTALEPRAGMNTKEKRREATTKPTMNLGKRYQISMAPGLSPLGFRCKDNVAHIASPKAQNPIRTF